jgi:lipoprotein-releasing system permease protein
MLYYQNPEVTNPEADPANAFQTLKLHPAATFTSEAEFDEKYVLAPLPLVQQLFHAERKYSAIEINTDPAMVEQVRDEVRRIAGPGFRVQTRFEQNQTLYMVMGGEKWAIYAILLFVLFIASFNMVAALSMLVVEKQKDIAILRAMGADRNTLRGIFLLEGVLWSLIGGVTGLVLGTCICLLQEKTGLVKMQDGMTADAFPISVTVPDILLVLVTIITVGFLAAWYPAARAGRIREVNLKSN